MQPISLSSSSPIYSVGPEESEAAAADTATNTDVDAVGGVANENATVDSDVDGSSSDKEEAEGIEDEGFVDSELRLNNDGEGNADQTQFLFMHLKETMMLDVCYNFTLGGTKITNYCVCCEGIYSEFICDEIFAFVCVLLGVRGKVDETESCAVPGYRKEEVIKAVLLCFFRKFVMCQKCGHKMKKLSGYSTATCLKSSVQIVPLRGKSK